MGARRMAVVRGGVLAGVLLLAAPLSIGASARAAEGDHLLTWGDNSDAVSGTGAPGNVAFLPEATLVQAPGGLPLATLAQSPDHGLGIDAHGAVWAWGSNGNGELGQDPAALPLSADLVRVDALPDGVYTEVGAGTEWSAALAADGEVYAWGWGQSGQLGNGTTPTAAANPVPVRVHLPLPAVELQVGALFAVARLSDGTLWSWGDNAYGQLGLGPAAPTVVNLPVELPIPAEAVSFPSYSVADISMTALDDSGALWGWGSNLSGNLAIGSDGSGEAPERVFAPTRSLMPDDVTYASASAGDFTGMALGDDARLYWWGTVPAGDGGPALVEPQPHPVPLPAGTQWRAGYGCQVLQCAALSEEGALYTWGNASPTPPTVMPYTAEHPAGEIYVGEANVYMRAAAEAPEISTATLPSGELGHRYAADVAVTGTPLTTVKVAAGTLPEGVVLGAAGHLEGTPARAGDFSFTIAATSAAGESRRDYTVSIGEGRKAALAESGADAWSPTLLAVAFLVLGGAFIAAARMRRVR